MNEIWKDIDGYEGLYQVSNLGRVKNINYRGTKKERLLKSRKSRDGYLQLCLCKDGFIKMFYVHRLVAETFIYNPQNLPCVNHKDENKQNNCLENLEWMTIKDNVTYSQGKVIKCFDVVDNKFYYFDSQSECERQFNFPESTVNSVLRHYKNKIYKNRYIFSEIINK